MKDELFDTEEKINLAKANFKTLKTHAGWQMLVKIVEANIKVLENQILDGFEEETKDAIDRKRDKLRAYKEIIGTPDFWLEKFEEKAPFQDPSDPYDTVESMKDQKKR